MGTTKLMGEKLITAANFRENNKRQYLHLSDLEM